MNYIVKSGYVDIYICSSKTNAKYCSEIFGEPEDKFVFIPFGVNDFSKETDMTNPPADDYILSLGRSNRDWDFLINGLEDVKYPVRIVCDELHRKEVPDNITIYNNVWDKESYEFIYNCKCMVIPIEDGRIASGETVLLQAMSFGKPIIITKPSCLADDYVEDGQNGIVINKEYSELQEAVERLFKDDEYYYNLSKNARNHYVENHSLFRYGCNVGKLVNELKA